MEGPDPKIVDTITRYSAPGRCIYCRKLGDADNILSDERVVPLSLNRKIIIDAASCRDCKARTSSIIGHCSRTMFDILRSRHNYKSRKHQKRLREARFPVQLGSDESAAIKMVPAGSHPLQVVLPVFNFPEILSGQKPKPHWGQISLLGISSRRVLEAIAKAGITKISSTHNLNPATFSRMLAQIAHGIGVIQYGLDGFRPFLIRHILHGDPYASHFIGCAEERQPTDEKTEHDIEMRVLTATHHHLIIAKIRLFSYLPTPTYVVVVGQRVRPSDTARNSTG